MSTDLKTLVIVPAYNEDRIISKVIKDIRESLETADIIVINDGSIDKTADNAKKSGVEVISLPYNLGIGGAVQTGFMYALKKQYDMTIQFDGDGQHRGDQIKGLITPIPTGETDVVIGSRYLNNKSYASSFLRELGISIFSLVNSAILNQKITDSTSGFRAYNKKAIEFLSENYPQDYPEPESIILLRKNGFRIKEISVMMRQRAEGKSSITFLLSIYYMIKVMLAILVGVFRKPIIKEGVRDGK